LTSKLTLYFHTLGYLKPIQIYRRIWFFLVRPNLKISFRLKLRPCNCKWTAPAERPSSLLDAETFIFLNKIGSLSELNWDGAQQGKLWRYNQHYFDDLNAINAMTRTEWHQQLLNRWVRENPPAVGTGWNSYPTSLRIVNWVKWQHAGNQLTDECIQSLAVQARWLSRRIEWHLLGNHLFANAKALIFAGSFFAGNEADGWINLGLKIIKRELPEQILVDGGNFERSPMYHSIFLEDILDLINLADVYKPLVDLPTLVRWRAYASKMLGWLDGMCHPDGEISFFNDAALGIAPTPNEIIAYALRLGIQANNFSDTYSFGKLSHFPDSGYVRVALQDAVMIMDVAPIGPDYLPGHSHADTLSFEMSVFGQRFIVNGGTSQYGNSPLRLEERGTLSHTTVEINDQNSSEVWSSFRVARRAYPIGLKITECEDSVLVKCGHDGYRRLPGKPVHWREWECSGRNVIVRDYVEGAYDYAVARYLIHPEMKLLDHTNRRSLLQAKNKQIVCIEVISGNSNLGKSFYSPEFGKRIDSYCLNVVLGSQGSIVKISW
jgi:uncharacterized heparinase superfamily protein